MSMADKWSIHRMLCSSKIVAAHIPTTRTFNYTNFKTLLIKYHQVFIKPVGGSCGVGVTKVSIISNEKFKVHIDNRTKYLSSISSAYHYIKRLLGKTRCIVQRGINLAKINGRPFDLRVMMQRTRRYKPWTLTGVLAKIAGKNYVITNMKRSKGRVVPFSTITHASSTIYNRQNQIKSAIRRVSMAAVKRISAYHPRMRTIGIDIGITSSGKVYLIEANSRPMIGLFWYLKDKSTYRRIVAFYKAKDNNS